MKWVQWTFECDAISSVPRMPSERAPFSTLFCQAHMASVRKKESVCVPFYFTTPPPLCYLLFCCSGADRVVKNHKLSSALTLRVRINLLVKSACFQVGQRLLAAKRTHKPWQKCYFLANLVTHMCERYNATRGVVQNEIESREKKSVFHRRQIGANFKGILLSNTVKHYDKEKFLLKMSKGQFVLWRRLNLIKML